MSLNADYDTMVRPGSSHDYDTTEPSSKSRGSIIPSHKRAIRVPTYASYGRSSRGVQEYYCSLLSASHFSSIGKADLDPPAAPGSNLSANKKG